MKRGLLIIDRGSREKEASQELETICQEIKKNRDYVITNYCFLEVEPPYIEAGIAKCLKEGIDSLTMSSIFSISRKKSKKCCMRMLMKFQKDTKIKFLVTKTNGACIKLW